MGHDGHCFGWPVRHSERHRVRLSGHLRQRRVPTGAGPGAGCVLATAHPGHAGRASGRARRRQASAVSPRAHAMLPTPQPPPPSTLAQQRTAPAPLACALALVIAPVAALAQVPAVETVAKTSAAPAPADRRALRAKSARRTPATSASVGAIKATLSAAELAIAEHVHVGRMPCELGAFVTVTADPATPGYFHVQGKGFKYHMAPVLTSTGTARLEDTKGGAVWLQIANKSMLMSQRLGRRLADACMSPAQMLADEALGQNPPPSRLEPLPAPPVAPRAAPTEYPTDAQVAPQCPGKPRGAPPPPDSNDSPHWRKKMLQAYRDHAAERAAPGIPPPPLNAREGAALGDLIRNPPAGAAGFLLHLAARRGAPGGA